MPQTMTRDTPTHSHKDDNSSEKSVFDPSRSSSRTQFDTTLPIELVRRTSLAALSVSADQYPAGEPRWPSGWRPYACLFGGFLLMFNSWGLVNAYGTYASYYNQHLLPGKDILLLNLVGSTESFVVLILSGVVGRFLDAGHSRELMILGTILVSLGQYLLSVVNGSAGYDDGNYGLIWLTQGLVSGLGMACFFVTSSQVVATWFKRMKGFAIGCVASGASIAGLVYPMMGKFLLVEVGFNSSTRYVATVVTLTSALAFIIARPNPEHKIRKPERWSDFRVFVDTQAFRNPSFAWFTAAICFLFFGFYAVFFNLEEWAAATGLGYKDKFPGCPGNMMLPDEVPKDAIRTFYLLSIMNGSSTLGRLSSAYLCDHLGAMNVHAAVTFVASLLVLILWTMANTVSAAIAFVVLFGVFSGAVIGLPPASVAHILGPTSTAQAKLGQWTGMMYTCSALFALTGPVIAGHLITEFNNNYVTVQCWSGASLLLSAICMATAIFYKRRNPGDELFEEKRRRVSFRSTARTIGCQLEAGEGRKESV